MPKLFSGAEIVFNSKKKQNTWARDQMKNWTKLYSKNFSIHSKKTLKAVS